MSFADESDASISMRPVRSFCRQRCIARIESYTNIAHTTHCARSRLKNGANITLLVPVLQMEEHQPTMAVENEALRSQLEALEAQREQLAALLGDDPQGPMLQLQASRCCLQKVGVVYAACLMGAHRQGIIVGTDTK